MTALTAMKQALEALKDAHLLEVDDGDMGVETLDYSVPIENLRAAIAELEQVQPFGYYDRFNDVLYTGPAAQQNAEDAARGGNKITPLYAAPPAPAIPTGWWLAREEPTEHQLYEGAAQTGCSGQDGLEVALRVFKAMRAAAPQPPRE